MSRSIEITTSVEVDLCEIDTDDLIAELGTRVLKKHCQLFRNWTFPDLIAELGTRVLKKSEKMEVLNAIGVDVPEIDSLVDQEKYDLFMKNFGKVSLVQLEGFFKEF